MESKPRIKVCGITRQVDADYAATLGAFALGFIFYKKSPRYIAPDEVKKIIDSLPPGLRYVGVFVNSPADEIRSVVKESGVDTVQLHGDETAADCAALSDLKVWKAFRLRALQQFNELQSFHQVDALEALLYDASVPGQYGGTGHLVDWDILDKAPRVKPLIVSGGLHPDNIREAWTRFQPYALDLSSGVESSPGIKDHGKLKRLFSVKG